VEQSATHRKHQNLCLAQNKSMFSCSRPFTPFPFTLSPSSPFVLCPPSPVRPELVEGSNVQDKLVEGETALKDRLVEGKTEASRVGGAKRNPTDEERTIQLILHLAKPHKSHRSAAFNFLTGHAHIRKSIAAIAADPPAKKKAIAAL